MTRDRPHCIVIGVGNPDRGDDAAGLTVARELRHLQLVDVELIEHSGETATLVLQMVGADQVFFIDACVSGAPPGTIHRLDVSSTAIPASASAFSTHGFGPATAVELARALGQLPRQCVIYAIEGASFEAGTPLSPPVAAAVSKVLRRLRNEIAGDSRQESRVAEHGLWLRHFAG